MPGRRKPETAKSTAATVILLVLLAGVMIYFALAGGEAQQTEGEVRLQETGSKVHATLTPQPTQDAQTPLPEKIRDSQEVVVGGMDVYLLQYGAFEKEENALSALSPLKQRGLAGYVLNENGRYKVMAQAFTSEEAARRAQQRLGEDETYVVLMKIEDIVLKVEAQKEQISVIRSAWWKWKSTFMQLMLLQDMLEFDETSLEEGRTYLAEMKNTLEESAAKLEGTVLMGEKQPLLSGFMQAIEQTIKKLEEALALEKDMELGSAVKALVIHMAQCHRDYANGILKS